MTYILKEKEMQIGETRIYADPTHSKYDVEITRTSINTFGYRIITVVPGSEFKTHEEAKKAAEKHLAKLP